MRANLLQEGSDKDEGEVDPDVQDDEDMDDKDEGWTEDKESEEEGTEAKTVQWQQRERS